MKALGILLLIAGACSYLFRAFNEMFHIQPNFSSEEGLSLAPFSVSGA